MMKRVVVFGLDCAAPDVLFGDLGRSLPFLSGFLKNGSWGPMRSSDPPLTIPAWSCMVTGKDPGILGCYGIRNRLDYSYRPMAILNSRAIREPRIWDIFTERGLSSIVVGVPQTFPVWDIRGVMISSILTPDTKAEYVFPASLKPVVENIAGGYVIDIDDYRKVSRDRLIGDIRSMTEKRFKVFKHLIGNTAWDFAMMVEIGLDRLHHCYWQYYDRSHPLYLENNGYEQVIPEYYELLDTLISEVVSILPSDTVVMIVSDHGAQPMQGGFRINQWLIREGLLKLKNQSCEPGALNMEQVDWNQTAAWGEGGYMGRIFLNVKGREPLGVIPRSEYIRFRDELKLKLENIRGPDGNLMDNRVLIPEHEFTILKGIPPDLMVYYGNLAWRSLSEIGHEVLFTLHNDQGPDGANHAINGVFACNVPAEQMNPVQGLSLYDITPTILREYGIEMQDQFRGRPIQLQRM